MSPAPPSENIEGDLYVDPDFLLWKKNGSWASVGSIRGTNGSAGIKGDKGDKGDTGAPGTPSKAIHTTVATTNSAGVYTWTFPTAFPVAPRIVANVQANADVFDVKITSVSASSCTVQIGRTQASAVALLGLTILSLPSSVGAQTVHIIAIAA